MSGNTAREPDRRVRVGEVAHVAAENEAIGPPLAGGESEIVHVDAVPVDVQTVVRTDRPAIDGRNHAGLRGEVAQSALVGAHAVGLVRDQPLERAALFPGAAFHVQGQGIDEVDHARRAAVDRMFGHARKLDVDDVIAARQLRANGSFHRGGLIEQRLPRKR